MSVWEIFQVVVYTVCFLGFPVFVLILHVRHGGSWRFWR